MSVQSIGRPIGTSFALTAFAIAIVSGLLAQNDSVTVLGRAIVVLVVARVVGAILGWVLARVATDAAASTDRVPAVPVPPVVGHPKSEASKGEEQVDRMRSRQAA